MGNKRFTAVWMIGTFVLATLACNPRGIVGPTPYLTYTPYPTPTPEAIPMVLTPPTPMTSLAFSDDFSDPVSGWPTKSEETSRVGYERGEYFIENIDQQEGRRWANHKGLVFSVPRLWNCTLSPRARWVTHPGLLLSDFAAEVQVRFDTDVEYITGGLIWRWRDPDNFYRFRIYNTGGYELRKSVDGKWQTLIEHSSSPHIKKGIATNRLRVVADVNLIRIYVNDQHLADVTDSSFNQGRIGLYASVFTEESPIVVRTFFDNLKVYIADTK